MLVLLTRVLLWATIGLLVWYILLRIIPKKYLTWFGGVVVLVLIVASFIDPNDQTIGSIWRIISLPLTPLGATVLLLGFSLSDGLKRVKGQQVAAALTILLLTSMPVFARNMVGQAEQSVQKAFLERQTVCQGVCPAEIPATANLGRAGAIVVFGDDADVARGNVLFRNLDETAYNSALVPRILYAADLYRQSRQAGGSPFVVVTAGPRESDAKLQEKSAILRSLLTGNGVPDNAIRLQPTGMNVYTTARDVELFMENQRALPVRDNRSESTDPRIILVAPAISMARAALTFENMGMQVIAKPTDFYTTLNGDSDLAARLPDIIPSVDALDLTTRYWNEFLTSIYYFLRGWLPGFNVGWNPNIEV
jgi:uncharacterized SAM-binding protein YcdF (DUF218 family)